MINQIKPYLILLFALLMQTSFAQPKNYNLDEISKAYVGQDAVMLSSKDNITIDFDRKDSLHISSKHEQDIYFLTANTKYLSDEYIPYSSFNTVSNIKALLYENKEGKFTKKVVKELVVQDNYNKSVFYDDDKLAHVVFPSITKGSISSIAYDETYHDPHLLTTTYYFASYIPINIFELSVEFPPSVTVKYKLFNDNGAIQFKEERTKTKVTYTWTAKKLKKYDSDEEFALSYFEPHICIYIADYTVNNKKIDVLANEEVMYKWRYSLIKDLNKEDTPVLKALTDSLVKDKTSDYEKAKAIFYWVQTNIKYVAFENGYAGLIPRTAKEIFQKRFGDCKDMSNIQTKMYEYAGLKSHLVWIGTRDIPYSYHDIPTDVDNHMIAAVSIGDSLYYADGTAYFIPLSFPSDAIQGKEGLITIDSSHYLIQKIPVVAKERNSFTDASTVTIDGETLQGKSVNTYTGYFNFNESVNLVRTSDLKLQEHLNKELRKGSNKCKIDTFSISPIDRDKDLSIAYNFTIPNYVNKVGDVFYVNINLDKNLIGDKIDTAKQHFDKKINFKNVLKYDINLVIPQGYLIKKLPESSSYKADTFGFTAQYSIDKETNIIHYHQYIYIDTLAVPASKFDSWNTMIQKLVELYLQVIELEKSKN